MRSRLEPMKKVARMIRDHLWGIVNAMALRVTNAASKSVNSKVQRIKCAACAFRSRDRFRNAIYFHLGGLELYPAGVSSYPHEFLMRRFFGGLSGGKEWRLSIRTSSIV
jgi:transposase